LAETIKKSQIPPELEIEIWRNHCIFVTLRQI